MYIRVQQYLLNININIYVLKHTLFRQLYITQNQIHSVRLKQIYKLFFIYMFQNLMLEIVIIPYFSIKSASNSNHWRFIQFCKYWCTLNFLETLSFLYINIQDDI